MREKILVSDNIGENDRLYHYMSLAQFISLIENKKLFLKKVKLWDDPWEAPDDQLPLIKENGSKIFSESLLVQSTVGQCWTYEKDSDAMWRIYSPDKQGVMIETSVNKFKNIDSLKFALLSKVIYYTKENYIAKRYEVANNKSYGYAGDMALKREAFKHENEVRLLMCLQGFSDIVNAWEIPILGLDIDINDFIENVVFDPRADNWYVDTMKKYCKSKGLICETKKSDLYEKDFYKKSKYGRRYVEVKDNE